jgi:alcohol dehydrogenase, propanol-preferring
MDRPVTETMAAVRLTAWQSPPSLVSIPVPRPGPTDVVIRVEAAGLCHSDLHVMDAQPGALPYDLPFTLGHEVAGVVVDTGSDTSAFSAGDAVVVHGVWSCGRCSRCLTGRENYCSRRPGAVGCGLGRDGGLAEFLLVPAERFLVPTHGVPASLAAPLADAGLTSYHAIRRSVGRLSGSAVVVAIGIGGLGHLAIQILRATTSASVVAVDARVPALALAERCGAHASVHPTDASGAVARLSDGQGADLVLDFVGSTATLTVARALLATDSDLTIVGGGGGTLVAGKSSGLPVACSVSTPFWGTRAELDEVMSLASRGLLRPEIETFAFGDVLPAYGRLRAGDINGRAVALVNH